MTETALTSSAFLTICCAAAVTYLLRIGGLMLAGRLPGKGKCKRFMDALPGTILLSLIAPAAVSAGVWGLLGALVTAACAYKSRNIFLSLSVGVLLVALLRHF